jgi:hypothetical protein
MSEAIGQPGGAALPRPMGIGEILSTPFQFYQRHWRTLLAIAAVVVVLLNRKAMLRRGQAVTQVLMPGEEEASSPQEAPSTATN